MDYIQIANTVSSFARSGTSFIYILAVAVGVVLVISAIRMLIIKGMGPQTHETATQWGAIAFRLLIGALLTTMGWTLSTIMGTTGQPTELQSALAYVQNASSDAVSQAIWGAIRAWCVFIGTAGFMRGFLILDRATAGGRDAGDDVWRAFWHILGGAITIQLFS